MYITHISKCILRIGDMRHVYCQKHEKTSHSILLCATSQLCKQGKVIPLFNVDICRLVQRKHRCTLLHLGTHTHSYTHSHTHTQTHLLIGRYQTQKTCGLKFFPTLSPHLCLVRVVGCRRFYREFLAYKGKNLIILATGCLFILISVSNR